MFLGCLKVYSVPYFQQFPLKSNLRALNPVNEVAYLHISLPMHRFWKLMHVVKVLVILVKSEITGVKTEESHRLHKILWFIIFISIWLYLLRDRSLKTSYKFYKKIWILPKVAYNINDFYVGNFNCTKFCMNLVVEICLIRKFKNIIIPPLMRVLYFDNAQYNIYITICKKYNSSTLFASLYTFK